MFRSLSGLKADYHHLTLLLVSEFDEWKVLVFGAGVTIHGTRQFGEAKAKAHALALAQQYLHEKKKADLPEVAEVEWRPTTEDDWLIWRA